MCVLEKDSNLEVLCSRPSQDAFCVVVVDVVQPFQAKSGLVFTNTLHQYKPCILEIQQINILFHAFPLTFIRLCCVLSLQQYTQHNKPLLNNIFPPLSLFLPWQFFSKVFLPLSLSQMKKERTRQCSFERGEQINRQVCQFPIPSTYFLSFFLSPSSHIYASVLCTIKATLHKARSSFPLEKTLVFFHFLKHIHTHTHTHT